LVWCVWQLIVLNRPSADSDDSVRKQNADKTLSAPVSDKIGYGLILKVESLRYRHGK